MSNASADRPVIDERARQRARLLWITAGVCILAFVALYVVFVLTVWGQTLDGRAYGARWASPIRLGERREHILRTVVTETSLAPRSKIFTSSSSSNFLMETLSVG